MLYPKSRINESEFDIKAPIFKSFDSLHSQAFENLQIFLFYILNLMYDIVT